MKLAANISLLYRELPMLERVAAAARDGFDGVEIQFPYDVAASDLRSALESARVPLALINTPRGPNEEPGLAAVQGAQALFREGFQRALRVAETTGCPTIHVMAGKPGTETGISHVRVLAENLRWAAPLAQSAGVALTLEPLNRDDAPGYAYHLPRQAVQVLEQVGAPNVRLQFDLYHAAREGLDVVEALIECRRWIHHVQVADAPSRHEPDLAKPQLRSALQTLLGWPYRGWLGLEYNPSGETSASLGWMPSLRRMIAQCERNG